MRPEIVSFRIWGLFDQYDHEVDFRRACLTEEGARVAVLIGKNGVGKTTILNMIEGILELDFSSFRKVPFRRAVLELSTGDQISAEYDQEKNILIAKINEVTTGLSMDKAGPSEEYSMDDVDKFREAALPILTEVSYQKVDIHRSIALRDKEENNAAVYSDVEKNIYEYNIKSNYGKLTNKNREKSFLSNKVKRFVREAQVDYRKYFSSEGPALFPKIIKRLQDNNHVAVTSEILIARLGQIKESEHRMSRFGLAMNISDIEQLSELLINDNENTKSAAVIAALEAYVETLESKHLERELIAKRLETFEKQMNRFFDGKQVFIDHKNGLTISTYGNKEIKETELSSGEYHLLYMMITALVSTRSGTAIAIDEPELSLHVSWQRELISALAECASGASPLFIFATHSPAIASEYRDVWIELA